MFLQCFLLEKQFVKYRTILREQFDLHQNLDRIQAGLVSNTSAYLPGSLTAKKLGKQ